MRNAYLFLLLAVAYSSLSIFPTFANAEFFAYIPIEKSKGGTLEDGAIKFNPSSKASGEGEESEDGESTDPNVLACRAKKNLALSLSPADLQLIGMHWDKARYGFANTPFECVADFKDKTGAFSFNGDNNAEVSNRLDTLFSKYEQNGIYLRVSSN